MSDDVYRKLQQHLDSLPIGYPATESGVEIRILKHLFTPEEAKIATSLTYKTEDLETIDSIYERMKPLGYSMEELEKRLDTMVDKGAIRGLIENGKKTYGNAFLAIGMFEYQVNKLTKEFVEDFHEYFMTFALNSIKTGITQLRTIPVGIAIDHEPEIASYDDVKTIVENLEGPLMSVECVCRQSQKMVGNKCKATDRMDVCMAFGKGAQAYIDRGWGKEITKEEALEILKKNEEDGLIFQPSNSIKADFICSCCTCCCETLVHVVQTPDPAMFFTTNHYAESDPELCTGCQTCVDRCQLEAITMEDNVSSINRKRCVGCGNCVVVCPEGAISLKKKEKQYTPPETMTDTYDNIAKKNAKIVAREKRKQERLAKR